MPGQAGSVTHGLHHLTATFASGPTTSRPVSVIDGLTIGIETKNGGAVDVGHAATVTKYVCPCIAVTR